MLKNAGYDLLEAENGEEALDVYERHRGRIRFVITDVVMPRMNGTQLAKELFKLDPVLHVLSVSAYSAELSLLRREKDERVHLLPKPLSGNTPHGGDPADRFEQAAQQGPGRRDGFRASLTVPSNRPARSSSTTRAPGSRPRSARMGGGAAESGRCSSPAESRISWQVALGSCARGGVEGVRLPPASKTRRVPARVRKERLR